jgi:streptomycin 6-kinase
MEKLIQNVTDTWGDNGRAWLNQLPAVIKSLSQHWSLTDINPVTNLSYNYVAKAIQNNITPVVLKISCDAQLILDEYNALKHFAGAGSIQARDMSALHNAMLLEQAIPGQLLSEHHSINIEDTIAIYAGVVTKIATPQLTKNNYTHVRSWCAAIDRIKDRRIEKCHVQKAKELRTFLLSSVNNEYLCHGDLHLENIIVHGAEWLSIDPKGVIGEMAFEAAAFNFLDTSELFDSAMLQNKITARVAYLARALQIDNNRLLAWVFLRAIIAAQWFIEDNGDADAMLRLAAAVYPLVENK